MSEEPILLGEHGSLLGIHTPAAPVGAARNSRLAMVLFNAGLIHHVGPGRLYVKLARALAARGIAAVRVDFSGIGDSPPRPDHAPAHELGMREPREMLDDLERRGYDGFILGGVCSGAKHAALAAGDPRVKGLVLINQELAAADPEAAQQVSVQYYLRRSLRNPRAWRNLFAGKVNYGALFTALVGGARRLLARGGRRRHSPAELLLEELAPALGRATPALIVLSDRHAEVLRLFAADFAAAMQHHPSLRFESNCYADHLFTSTSAQAALVQQVCEWAEELARTRAHERTPAVAPALAAR